MEQKAELGLKVFEEIMGRERAAGMRASASTRTSARTSPRSRSNMHSPTYGAAMDWSVSNAVSLRSAILIATRQTLEIKNHVRIGVRNGLTARELEETLVQCIPYVGFPAIASATTAVIETLRELGIDTQAKTSEERGLL